MSNTGFSDRAQEPFGDIPTEPEAFLLSAGKAKAPAAIAARVLGTAGHAHDWDDTQVSRDPAHIYGLLTHPSVPPLRRTSNSPVLSSIAA